VYLAKAPDLEGGFHDLGRLKGNEGNQNYNVPSEADPEKYRVVVIWCRAFSVPFGYAELGLTSRSLWSRQQKI
jgi:hypothetical protein